MEKGELLETICVTLTMTEDELKKREHETDITKTCRKLTKYVYRDLKKRASERVSTMDQKTLQAIQSETRVCCHRITDFSSLDYARLAHPIQARTPNSVLNNAIGNVFAAEKRKSGQPDDEVDDESEVDEGSDEE